MILGMGMNVASFNNPDVIRKLAEHYRVIAFDNRGIGLTTITDTPFSVVMMAKDTLGLMDALGIGKAHLVGGSLGACVAEVIAAEHQKRVNGLVLHGASSRYPLMIRTMVSLSSQIPFLRRQSVKMAEPIFKEPFPPTEMSYLNQCAAGAAFDGRPYLSKISSPTIIINLIKDQYVPMKFTRELTNGIRGSRLELIDRDHMFILNEPELMIRPALAFLEDLDRKTVLNHPE
jgi:pimeloyl-ACP methyl ester carboxylesterase